MTPNNNKPNFLDRGTVTAFVLILLFWFGWSKFMEKQNPPAPAPTAVEQKAATQAPATDAGKPAPVAAPGAPAVAAAAVEAPKEEKLLSYDSENLSFKLSSHGMGITDINIKKYRTRDDQPIVMGDVKGDLPFATGLVDTSAPIDFAVEQTAPDTFVGKATVNGLNIEKTMKVDPNLFTIDTGVKVTGQMDAFKGLATYLSEQMQPPATGGFLGSSSREYQDWYIRHEATKTRKMIQQKDGVHLTEQNVSLAALSQHYFSLAVVDHSDLAPKFESNVAAGATAITGRLTYTPISHLDSFTTHYVAFAGPKSHELLSKIDENLAQVVDFGMFGILGKPILWLLKFLYSLIGNWGWAILVLTIIVRAIVLPFNAYSYKSMKAMQRIQPEMARIREKYKDSSSEMKLQMNQEIMQLMKRNNASPMGGCLPTLLQLPVFFALYQVLGQSIELYRAPFIHWIHDLSARDPYFVLPVLMGITMFIQQRLTPTTMDPQQAKILMWMPLIFSVFMLSLPSGLTLYIFVSTLFGIIQQYMFMRDKSTVQGRVKEAKA